MNEIDSSRVARDPVLATRGLSRVFEEGGRSREVLRGVDLTVAPGECVALLGRSGSGKSTLLHLISGLDTPTSGTSTVDGTNLTALSDTDRTRFRRDHIGLVFQFFHLIPTLTVEENVVMPLDLGGAADRAGRARARDLLDRVGLGDRLDSFPDVLSGGEQQRVSLARALVGEPMLVLADEPTGNLDSENGEVVLDLLTSLCDENGQAVLMATHSRSAAERAGRLLVLEDGRIAKEDDAQRLLA